MVKVFDKLTDFEAYVLGGMIAGDLYYVNEDKSVHFRTNNIDGSDKTYSMSIEPVLIEGEFTENGTYEPEEADGYSSVVVNVAGGSEPELEWETVDDVYEYTGADLYLEMNVGTTYVFKSSAGDVEMYLGQSDTEGDGDVDIDDEFYPIGRMVPNKEYYLTATNDYVNAGDDYEYDNGKAYIFFNLNGGSSTIQYAVKPEPSEDSDSEDDSPVEPSNDSPVVGE